MRSLGASTVLEQTYQETPHPITPSAASSFLPDTQLTPIRKWIAVPRSKSPGWFFTLCKQQEWLKTAAVIGKKKKGRFLWSDIFSCEGFIFYLEPLSCSALVLSNCFKMPPWCSSLWICHPANFDRKHSSDTTASVRTHESIQAGTHEVHQVLQHSLLCFMASGFWYKFTAI